MKSIVKNCQVHFLPAIAHLTREGGIVFAYNSSYFIYFRFSKCGATKIYTNASNAISEVFAPPLEVTVLCEARTMSIFTTPQVASDGWVHLQRDVHMIIEIQLALGSSAAYSISWGDGGKSDLLVSNVFETRSLSATHLYNETGNFTVKIWAYDKVSRGSRRRRSTSKQSTIIKVQVSQCSPPLMTLSCSQRKDSPVEMSPQDRYVIKATHFHRDPNCHSFSEKARWVLQNETADVLAKIGASNLDDLNYEIPPNSLKTGDYTVTLELEWGRGADVVNTKYFAYIRVVTRNIRAIIDSGQGLQIPFSTMSGGNQSTYDFRIDGRRSFDPDNMAAKNNGIEYRWSCRVTSNQSLVDESYNIRMNANLSLEFHGNFCLSFNFQPLALTSDRHTETGVIVLNTAMFLQGLSYQMKMTIKKGDKEDSALQIIDILKGSAPVIQTL